MNRFLLPYILIFMFFCLPQQLFANKSNNDQIVIFGDSYSDNGNTFKKSSNTYPGRAYSLGRFTNGPTWSEYLAIKLGKDIMNNNIFKNYAYGQAQILSQIELKTHDEEKEWSFIVPDLSAQIDDYLKDVNINPQGSLFFIFIGTNDVLNYKPTSKRQTKEFVNSLLNHLNKQISRLKEIGAKRIIVFKWRDLKRFPLSKQLADDYQNNYLLTLEEMVEQFNQGLLYLYQNDNIVHLYDTYAFDYTVFSSLEKYQWKNHTLFLHEKEKACYSHGGNYIDYIHDKYCSSPWTYWFFDRIHPTTYIDYLMSEDVYFFLTKANLVE